MTENIISIDGLNSQTKLSTQGKFPMITVTLCAIQMRMIITDPEHLLDSRATWYCLTDLGEGIGYMNPKKPLELLKRRELDSRVFTNAEIILESFKGSETEPLANRGNTFVSLRGVLEILSKTELSSNIVDNFQDEVFGHLLPSLALTGSAELPNVVAKPDSYMTYPDREQWHMNDFGTRLFPKWACDVLDKVYDDDNTFLIEYRTV